MPKYFSLAAGAHTLILRGREHDTKIDRLTVQYVGPSTTPVVAPTTPTINLPQVILAPVITAIQSNAADVSSTATGLQVYEGSVSLMTTVSDQGRAFSWKWIYKLNGGADTTYASGSGSAAAATFTYPAGSGGYTYAWRLQASNGTATSEANFSVGVLPPAGPFSVTFEAEACVIQAPFVVANGSISQSVSTYPAEGGRAAYSFNAPTSGL